MDGEGDSIEDKDNEGIEKKGKEQEKEDRDIWDES